MIDQWQELKETITEMRDNDGTATQQEACKFLVNYMNVLEKEMNESKTTTPEEANITINYLKEMQEGYIEEEGYERYPLPEWYALDKAIETIEQTTWIPCDKKLPKPQEDGDKDYSEWVQITLHIGEDNDVVGRAFYCFSEKKWYTNGLGVGEVTAWMSLPVPYKPQKDEVTN